MAKKVINITMDVDLYNLIKKEADKKGVSFSGYLSFVCADKIQQDNAVGVLEEVIDMMKKEQLKTST